MNAFRTAVAASASTILLILTGACSGSDAPGSGSADGNGTRTFAVDEVHVSFDLPSDWKEFDLAKMQDALKDSSVMKDMEDRMGVTSEQLQQMVASNIVLYVTAPNAEDGFLNNVNALVIDQEMPSAGAFELQFRSLGATDIQTEKASTDAGDGYTTTYTLATQGLEAHGEAISIDTPDGVVVITISTQDAGDTETLANGVIDSLAPTS